jgi:hypothetical protein
MEDEVDSPDRLGEARAAPQVPAGHVDRPPGEDCVGPVGTQQTTHLEPPREQEFNQVAPEETVAPGHECCAAVVACHGPVCVRGYSIDTPRSGG